MLGGGSSDSGLVTIAGRTGPGTAGGGPYELVLEDAPSQEIEAGDVLVRVSAMGITATERGEGRPSKRLRRELERMRRATRG